MPYGEGRPTPRPRPRSRRCRAIRARAEAARRQGRSTAPSVSRSTSALCGAWHLGRASGARQERSQECLNNPADGMYARLQERLEFWSIPEPNSGCVLWTKSTRDGYGRIGITTAAPRQKRTVLVHRVAYELANGPIPDGLQLDHLCRVLINPLHMEPVTQWVNILRGMGYSAQAARRTMCPRGHAYDMLQSDGSRWCRTCTRAWDRARQPRPRKKGQTNG